MNGGKEVVLVSGARTAIGAFGGSLSSIAPSELGSIPAVEAIKRAGLTPEDIQQTVFGSVIHTEPRDMYISRVCALNAGVPKEVPALTVNRLCGSGMQAILTGAQMIQANDGDIVLAGGVESMSRAGYLLPNMRFGKRMGDDAVIDMMVQALHCPMNNIHMGETTENIVEQERISREEQDAFAVESHKRAAAAIEAGYFEKQIVSVDVRERKKVRQFEVDEHVRLDASIEGMAKLPAVFRQGGSVTPGNASGINDGAAAVVLMSAEEAAKRKLKPMARIASTGLGGVDPKLMGLGPVPAVQQALQRAGLTVDDLDVIESNEAFAGQALAVSKLLGLEPEKVNPNGGAVALGHPVGASGTIITIKCMYELQRIGGKYGLATMCIGGGQGIALVLEAI